MATVAFYRIGLVFSIIAFLLMFVAFATPYWYKSWTRVHSPFSNIGLWHVCFAGYIMPNDPVLKSYVGCWWIHSTEFELVKDHIQPVWFRFVQFFSVVVLLCNLVVMLLLCFYLHKDLYKRIYEGRLGRMFFINAMLFFLAAGLVFLISLVFAMKANDGSWMPRPWMNYLSWSYGFCVLSGFLDAFGGMLLFINSLIFADKVKRGEQDGIDSTRPQGEKDRGGEFLDSREPVQSYLPRPGYTSRPSETSYDHGPRRSEHEDFDMGRDFRMRRKEKEAEAASTTSAMSGPSIAASQGSKVNESFV